MGQKNQKIYLYLGKIAYRFWISDSNAGGLSLSYDIPFAYVLSLGFISLYFSDQFEFSLSYLCVIHNFSPLSRTVLSMGVFDLEVKKKSP